MNDMLETLTIDGYAVEIFHDPDIVKSPHTWCSSTLCIAHRRYNFAVNTCPAMPVHSLKPSLGIWPNKACTSETSSAYRSTCMNMAASY